MKYKPGTEVVIVNVPLQAALVGVQLGMPATVEGVEDEPEHVQRYLDEIGMTKVTIQSFTFWWLESDLGYRQ